MFVIWLWSSIIYFYSRISYLLMYNVVRVVDCCELEDSENIDFPIETAWTIATKKNVRQTDDNIVSRCYSYMLKRNMLKMSDLLDKYMSCLRLQMVCNLQVQVVAEYISISDNLIVRLIVSHFLLLTFTDKQTILN